MPDKLKPLGVTEEKFKESNAYGFDKSTYGLVRKVYSTIEECCYLYFMLYMVSWNYCEKFAFYIGLTEENPILIQMLFMTLVSTIEAVLKVPWSLYFDFVLEEKWGFNKKTMGLFVTDWIKSYFIELILMAIIVPVILTLIDWAGPLWYAYVWLFLSTFIFIMMWVYPTFIQPCFNKVEELETGEIRTAIEELASRISFL
eukprot:UN26520